MKRINWGFILAVLGCIALWIAFGMLVFGQEAKTQCPPPPPPPPPVPECDIELAYFQGEILKTVDEKLYARISWGIVGPGLADGEWLLMKVKYNQVKDTEEMWIHEIRTLKTPYFDGRAKDHYFDDYKITRRQDVFYVLVWRCGFCGAWEYYGPIHLVISGK